MTQRFNKIPTQYFHVSYLRGNICMRQTNCKLPRPHSKESLEKRHSIQERWNKTGQETWYVVHRHMNPTFLCFCLRRRQQSTSSDVRIKRKVVMTGSREEKRLSVSKFGLRIEELTAALVTLPNVERDKKINGSSPAAGCSMFTSGVHGPART